MPFEYAIAKHAASSFGGVVVTTLAYLAGSTAYAAVPLVLVLAVARPNRATIVDIIWPLDDERRLAAATFWGPLLLPTVAALAGGTNLSALWSMTAWTLLPVLLLSSPTVNVRAINQRLILITALAVPLMALIAAPVIAIAVHYAGVKPPGAHGRILAAEIDRAWRQATPQPLRFIGCNVADEVIAYAPDRPHSLPLHSYRGDIGDEVYADAHDWPRTSPAESASNEARLPKAAWRWSVWPTKLIGSTPQPTGRAQSGKPTHRRQRGTQLSRHPRPATALCDIHYSATAMTPMQTT